MAVSYILHLALVVLLINGISCSSNEDAPQEFPDDFAAEQCEEGDVAARCEQYFAIAGPKSDPSPECCSAIKKADIPCLCRNVSEDVEEFFSMEKLVYVSGKCGQSLPDGSKCGSYTIPWEVTR